MPSLNPDAWPLILVLGVFALTAVVLTIAGIRITAAGAALAERTGLGQALFGAAFIGGATSLSGIAVSVTAAATGYPGLALGNALGGIAAQTVFLAIADVTHRPANLEHAAASTANMLQAALLVTLLAIPPMALGIPEVAIFGVHPASIVMVLGYGFGLSLASKVRDQVPWRPRRTAYTVEEDGEEEDDRSLFMRKSLVWVWGAFLGLALVLGACGYVVSKTGVEIAERFDLSETVVGTFLTAVTTSLPELVTALAAVHRGALALAVGDVLGGNVFDTLLVAMSDVAYREGSIFTALDSSHVVIIGMSQILTGLVLLGLIRREQHGFGNIGFESGLSLLVYAIGAIFLLR